MKIPNRKYYCPKCEKRKVYCIRKRLPNKNGGVYYCPICKLVFKKIQLYETNNNIGNTPLEEFLKK